jgi:hypothetical protein
MNHSSSLRARNCRTLLTSQRLRRDALAERLDAQWQELRRHATIERDTERLLWLTAELEKRKPQVEVVGKWNSN